MTAKIDRWSLADTVTIPDNLGDYNGNGIVDAADFTVWRDNRGRTVFPGTLADGNGDATIDMLDYDYWVAQFGTVVPPAASVAEPGASSLVTVTDLGLNDSSNREWLVEVAPDPALFVGDQGSAAIELAFEVSGSDLVGATVNATDWPYENPGNNPFTGGMTTGLQLDLAGDTVFASLGSDLFTTGDAVEAMTIETLGAGSTTLSWGGHTLLPGTAFEYIGSRISQAGENYDEYQGSLQSGGGGPACDFTGEGACDIDDLNLMLAEGPIAPGVAVTPGVNDQFDLTGDDIINNDDRDAWLAGAATENGLGSPYKVGDSNLDGSVDVSDFNLWNGAKFTSTLNWDDGDFNGDGSADVSDFNLWNGAKFTSSDGVSAVPEPGTSVLLSLTLLGCGWLLRRWGRA
jgi:hypothetical protein